MKRLWLSAKIALLLCLLIVFSPVLAQDLPGRDATPVPTPDLSGWNPVGIIFEHLESGILWTWMFESAPTELPTEMPTPTLTRTPTATFTPSHTPTLTNTPEFQPPTQENTVLPPTLSETPPPGEICVLRNNNQRKNIRSAPSLSATILAKWEIGIEATFTEFRFVSPYLWGKTTAGWSAVREDNMWQVLENEGSAPCVDVPGWPTNLEPPTPGPLATPTPRPPETPIPTITPDPVVECQVITLFNINEREDHFTGTTKLDTIGAGSTVTVDEFWADPVYLWGRTFQGWFVVMQFGPPNVWWVGSAGGTPCNQVSGWPIGLAPPAVLDPLVGVVRDGPHYSWFSDHNKARESAPFVGLAKCLTLTGSMCDTIKGTNPDVVTIFRDYRSECPSLDQVYYDPAGYYQRLRQLWAENPGFDYYEIMNECTGLRGTQDYAALAQFTIEVASRAAADGYCILGLSSFPGAPEIDEFLQLLPYFEFADANPCGRWPNGAVKFHGLATHATGYCPFATPDFPWVGWVWVAGRHTLFAEALAQVHRYDIANKRWPWFITELGWAYGYSEDENAYTAQQLQACNQETQAKLAEQGIVQGYAIWSFGLVDNWLDYVSYMPGIFQ